MTGIVTTLGTAALFVAAVGIIAFTVLYGVWSNWRATAPGRAVFWLAVSLSALTLLVFWAVLDQLLGWHTDQIRNVYRSIAYATVAVTSCRLVVTLWKTQRGSTRKGSPHDRASA